MSFAGATLSLKFCTRAMPSDEQVIHVINEDALPETGHCALEGRGVVVCRFRRMEAALEVTAGDPSLKLIRRADLSPEEQARVQEAFLA